MDHEIRTLELPILDAIEQRTTRHVAPSPLPPPIDVIDYKVQEAGAAFPKMLEYGLFLRLGFRYVAPPEASSEVAGMAKRSMAHHLYGPIIDHLMLLREDLYELGVPTNSKASKRLNMILDTLRGSMK